MSGTPIYIVCSPHAKTGTSTVTRLLCDYLTFENRPFALFDTDPHSRALGGWFPHACTISDLSTTRGQIALFDRLVSPGAEVRIVEVSSQIYTRFFTQVRDIGLVDEAGKNGFEPVILFVSNGSKVAIEAAHVLEQALCGEVIPVVNQGPVQLGETIYDHLDAFEARHSFQVPRLDGSARNVIENPRFSLSGFLKAPSAEDMSLVVRADLRSWLKRVFTQLHAYQVRKAFDESNLLGV
ncbi:MAG: hypothetical protein JWN07_1933 [Hyphomicrobiales bacterium]|nr:hypothetical protein [Hyphomicrobiales bacterium]